MTENPRTINARWTELALTQPCTEVCGAVIDAWTSDKEVDNCHSRLTSYPPACSNEVVGADATCHL